MSGRTITRYILICDGCGKELEEAASSVEARAAAWSQGWRMPPRVKLNGHLASRSDDVCPHCLPDWKPNPLRREE
jgi:hypothetical protein